MPPLDMSGRKTSFFEFWPVWLMYVPVVIFWILLAIRYRSLSLPLIANPAIPLSGMVGVAKSAVFETAGNKARECILPWCIYEVVAGSVEEQYSSVLEILQAHNLALPIVGKPDFGCRGVGVKLINSGKELRDYLVSFPVGGSIQFQKLSEWDAEAGVFYVRDPESNIGEITSLTLKYTPYVVGDGISTLAELIAADPRAGNLQHLYYERHECQWRKVIPEGEPYRLAFAASHSRGAIFRDASYLIDIKLTQSLDRVFDDIPGYFYGRLDIKFEDVESLKLGKKFDIIEINGASSESINIWDRNTNLLVAIRTLLQQYHTLFKLGHINRKDGYEPPGLIQLFKAWRYENDLVKKYPCND